MKIGERERERDSENYKNENWIPLLSLSIHISVFISYLQRITMDWLIEREKTERKEREILGWKWERPVEFEEWEEGQRFREITEREWGERDISYN